MSERVVRPNFTFTTCHGISDASLCVDKVNPSNNHFHLAPFKLYLSALPPKILTSHILRATSNAPSSNPLLSEYFIVTAVDSLMAPFYDNPRYSDITIKFAQHQIRAHKVILVQQSKYFATAFFSGFQVNTSSAMNDARLTPPGCIKPCHRSG